MRKLLILKTNKLINYEEVKRVREQVDNALDSGILIIDKNWTYELIEFDDLNINGE